MRPASKAKAEKLVLKYLRLQENESTNWFHKGLAKQCALIAVDEILNVLGQSGVYMYSNLKVKYWQEVKQEIEKL